ncbi:chemotaxis protein CheW [Hylemonella gracilis str. Niagara R]|uniref:Chemotaxis protein CheW n=1 Tax=Hylemonella gracilis str. Niagara R TaxID=1458275 RepID=A0A016XLY0_9BURK|nr:cache domain-containing protein [Hylemonella gracilis]EYC52547.1 chemotaxis protein CheW [Hylemonella gracilis str. Niagara R]
MSSTDTLPAPEQWLRYMPGVERQRQELRLVENAWDQLSLLSSFSLLSSNASSGGDLARARQDFSSLSIELMHGLAAEAVHNCVDDLSSRAQICIDVLVRNLFERTADIGFFSTDVGIAHFLGAPADERRPEQIASRLRQYASKYTVYDNIYLFDAQCQLAAALHEGPGLAVGAAAQGEDVNFLRQVMASDAPYAEDYAVRDFIGQSYPCLAYAHRVEAGGQVVGVLVLSFKMSDEMLALFASIQGKDREHGGDVVLALVDAHGEVLASSDTHQLPLGWRVRCDLPPELASGAFMLQHFSRRYLAVVREARSFQGYAGPGWRGLALLPLDVAFDDATSSEHSALIKELAGNADFLSEELREIPRRSVAIQSALERSVWNGLLELNQMQDGTEGRNEVAAPRDLLFAKTLLSEIGATARKTARAFSSALEDLYGVVTRSILRDGQSRADLAMQILDRNLYERANDCRWWALTPQFAETLAAGRVGCEQATAVLRDINALYTVYSSLVLFDRQGRVMAVSNPAQQDLVGTPLDEEWVARCLRLSSAQEYVVSAFAPSRFYDRGSTFIYAAAVRDAAAVSGSLAGANLGGIAIVWDAAQQLQSILGDCAEGCGDRDMLAFIDSRDQLVLAHGQAEAVAMLGTEGVIESCRTGGRMVNLAGHLHGVGMARGAGYREFRARDGYDHGLSCLALRHLCERKPAGAALPAPQNQGARVDATQRVQMATFMLGSYWLGIDAALVVAAAPDATALGAGPVRLPFIGLAPIGNRVCPLMDLRSIVRDDAGRGATDLVRVAQQPGAEGQAAAQEGGAASRIPQVQRAAHPDRQLIIVRVPLEEGGMRELALRVDALGPMLDLDRRKFQPVGFGVQTALIDAVIGVPVTASQGVPAAGAMSVSMLCQLSMAWLKQCAAGALPTNAQDQDLAALLQAHQEG